MEVKKMEYSIQITQKGLWKTIGLITETGVKAKYREPYTFTFENQNEAYAIYQALIRCRIHIINTLNIRRSNDEHTS
jgi:hypothetical protein